MLLASTIAFPNKPCRQGTLWCILSNSVRADFWLRPSKNFHNPLLQRIKDKTQYFWTIPAGFTCESQDKGFGGKKSYKWTANDQDTIKQDCFEEWACCLISGIEIGRYLAKIFFWILLSHLHFIYAYILVFADFSALIER